MQRNMVQTQWGAVAFTDSGGAGLPLLMIHGNSSRREAFSRQFDSPLADVCRMVAIDLLGHGDSDDASDPARAYRVRGFAETAQEVIAALGLDRPAVLGWSLGGHIAMEMAAGGGDLSGLMLVGAPPVAPGLLGMMRGFRSDFDLLLASKGVLTAKEAARFAAACFGGAADPVFVDAIRRTHSLVRPSVARCFIAGRMADARRFVAQTDIPTAIVNGAAEPFARLDYLDQISYGNLWQGRAFTIEGAGHAPFHQRPEAFNLLLAGFLHSAAAYRDAVSARRARLLRA